MVASEVLSKNGIVIFPLQIDNKAGKQARLQSCEHKLII